MFHDIGDSRIVIHRRTHKRHSSYSHRNLTSLVGRRKKPASVPKEWDTGDGNGPWGQPLPEIQDFQKENAPSETLTDEELMLCVPTVYGYGLKAKRWLSFDVEKVGPVKFNDTAFQSLVLPADQKELTLAFAESQVENKESFDDVIEGKGKGIIMLLSGGPDIGKTLTAEAVAEKMEGWSQIFDPSHRNTC